jgi:acetylornithine deacetylase/succinyl-diaminopimelate desuccinylase-like protein
MHLDWDATAAEVATRLRAMIRFDTTNPPGNETPLARYLARELVDAGVDARVLEGESARGNLVARIPGTGARRPLLLLSHLDVVPAEPGYWTHPPFAAECAQGHIWGRGAIDSKLTGALHMQLALMCSRLQLPLERDLVLVAAADEEFGGHHGAGWLTAQHPEYFDAEYALNEGGGFALLVDGQPLYTCQTAEKGSAPLNVVAHGRPGHSSVPHGENALFALGEALVRLAGNAMPHTITATVAAFLEAAAAAQARDAVGRDLMALLDPEAQAEALGRLPIDEPTRLMFDAMVRGTCAPTMVQAGIKRNVIPSEACLRLSGRPLPGVGSESFVGQVREIVGDDVSLCLEGFSPGLAFQHQGEFFAQTQAALGRYAPGATLVPYMQTGGTDARFLQGRDMTVFGFVPMRHEPGHDFFQLCHGHDERVSLANLNFGAQVLFDLVCRLNGVQI